MPTYVAFLRAINLGARRKFPKDAIVRATEAAGGTGVATWINTGNVRLDHRARSVGRVQELLEAAYAEEAGFEVPVIAYTPAELVAIRDHSEAIDPGWEVGARYVSLLRDEPSAEVVREAASHTHDGEHFEVHGRAAHLALPGERGFHLATKDNGWVERRLGVATNRNLTVIRAVCERWC